MCGGGASFDDGLRLLLEFGMKPTKAAYAAWFGNRPAARLLLPAKPSAKWTPFVALVESDAPTLEAWTSEHGGGAADPDMKVPLLVWAVGLGRDEDVTAIAAAGGDLVWRKISGATALAQAVMRKREGAATILLDAGADPNQKVYVRSQPPLFRSVVRTGSVDCAGVRGRGGEPRGEDPGRDVGATRALGGTAGRGRPPDVGRRPRLGVRPPVPPPQAGASWTLAARVGVARG